MTELTESERMIVTKYDLYFEGRLSKVESSIEHFDERIKEIKTDLRWVIGIMIGGFGTLLAMQGGMFAMMAHGFKWF